MIPSGILSALLKPSPEEKGSGLFLTHLRPLAERASRKPKSTGGRESPSRDHRIANSRGRIIVECRELRAEGRESRAKC